jgi:hypothetical protein
VIVAAIEQTEPWFEALLKLAWPEYISRLRAIESEYIMHCPLTKVGVHYISIAPPRGD